MFMSSETPAFHRSYVAKAEHIDVQGIMDGLYYPFYMEDCRHVFLREILNFDLSGMSQQGVNIVLTEYTIKFKRPLLKGDSFEVSCSARKDTLEKPVIYFDQQITRSGKITTEGVFTATCTSLKGGRPFIPEKLLSLIQ